MTTIKVCPLISVDGIPFGTSRADVRNACGNDFREFKKSTFSKNTSDDYGTFHVFYDKNNCMNAIEFFEGATVYVGSTQVFPANLKTVSRVFENLREDGGSYTSIEDSVSFTLAGENIECILFGTKGYFA